MNNTLRISTIAGLVAAALTAFQTPTFGAAIVGVNPTNTITASMDNGILRTGNTWYELGVNPSNPTSGLRTGLINGQSDPLSSYLIQPATGLNALLLDTNRNKGTLIFDRPVSVTALSLSGSSGNGTGTVTPTLRFTDGSTDTLPSVSVGDWFNNTAPRVETAFGRINASNNSFDTQSALSDNPRVYALNETLPTADQGKTIFAIDLSWSGASPTSNTHTAILGVSGDVTGLGHFTAIPLDTGSFNHDIIVGLAEVPEPGTLALFGLGVAGLVAWGARKSRS
jgi:hypothetical protein